MNKVGSSTYSPVRLDLDYIASKAFDRYGEKYQKISRNFSAYQKASLLEDFRQHIRYLQESLAIDSPLIFIDYIHWHNVRTAQEHLPGDYVSSSLLVLDEVLGKELPPDYRERTGAILRESIEALKFAPVENPSFISEENPHSTLAKSYLDALVAADRESARSVVQNAVKSGVSLRDLYLDVFTPVLREIGRLWQVGKVSIAQEHYMTATTGNIIAGLHDQVISSGRKVKRKGKTLVAACVAEELHEIGIRMVADFFEMDGWDTYYTGANTPAQSLLQATGDLNADVVAISSTMPFHLPVVHYLIRSLRADPGTSKARIIVGGYPFTLVPDLWRQIGADAFAGSADEAVAIANRLTSVVP
jgi:methanogenic corrinoid protein MtbC1